MRGRIALIGDTGFVGGNLVRQRAFDRTYNSKTIASIEGEEFDYLVCAGAPATMWVANRDPEGDRANLLALVRAIQSAKPGNVILISTIAVYRDVAGQCDESSSDYEAEKPYGRNRRELEVRLSEEFNARILRLPALFGPGLKKNLVFDILNPVPSFVQPAKYQETVRSFSRDEKALCDRMFVFDERLSMFALKRNELEKSGKGMILRDAFSRADFLATSFTNSESKFQFYNLERLSQDIDDVIEHDIPVLNICSVPLRAAEIHRVLNGREFVNHGPRRVSEDVRTRFSGVLKGNDSPYLYASEEIVADLLEFSRSERI